MTRSKREITDSPWDHSRSKRVVLDGVKGDLPEEGFACLLVLGI